MWFKSLVAVTCVAVLAAIGFWFYQQQQASQQAEAAELAAGARECRQIIADVKAGRGDYKVAHLKACTDNYITQAEVRDAGLGHVLDENPQLFGSEQGVE